MFTADWSIMRLANAAGKLCKYSRKCIHKQYTYKVEKLLQICTNIIVKYTHVIELGPYHYRLLRTELGYNEVDIHNCTGEYVNIHTTHTQGE